ncbi:MAG: LamG domain protein jellyroll fold domain protein [Fibrobacteres bacterium]|nr:LamG domain protein jellyroll fold domain protein [Fibrobacterota bacterium]
MLLARGDFSAWKDSTRIFIDASATGGNASTKLVNFPVLLRLNASMLDFSTLGAGGRDVRFADKDGIPLSHEIESFNASAKQALIWVKVPLIDSLSSSQYFVMYWNNPAAPDISNGGAVFDTSDGYAGVWHLSEDPAAAAGDTGTAKFYADATRNRNNGDDFVSSPRDTGAIGYGQSFDGFDDHVQIPSSPSLQLRGPLSLSIWCRAATLKPAADGDTLNALIRKGDPNPNSYQLAVKGGYVFLALDADDNSTIRSRQKLVTGRYYHIAATWAGKSVKLYINGEFDSEFFPPSPAGSLTQDAKPLQIGGRVRTLEAGSHDHWHGSLDEAWVSRLSHTPAYFKMSYENQKPGSTVLSFRAFPTVTPPILPQPVWAHSRKILLNTSATGANVAGSLADFPVLVRLNADLFDFTQAKADGSDLRFSDNSGKNLPYAIERWSAADKAAEIWVSVHNVAGNSSTGYITMDWGSAGATDAQNPAAVFDTAFGFAGVWHMDDGGPGSDGAAKYRDQTPNHNDGTDFAAPDPAPALVGKGQAFTVPPDRVEIRSSPSVALTSALTLSAWIKGTLWDTGTGRNNLIFRKGNGSPIAFDLSIKDGHLKLFLNDFDSLGTTGRGVLDTGKWYHVAAAWTGSTLQLYVNGKPDLAAPLARTGVLPQDTLPLFLGSRNHNIDATADRFKGTLDEMQVSRIARSADWIRLAYENQKANSRFTVHEGYESKVPAAETTTVDPPIILSSIPWTYDTILAPGAILQEKGVFRLTNTGSVSAHVSINPMGDSGAPGVQGSEALIRITNPGGLPSTLVFALDSNLAGGRSVFKLLPGTGSLGRLIDLGFAAKGESLLGPGSWIFARDTAAPVVKVLDQGVDASDSSWILISIEDNTAGVNVAYPQGTGTASRTVAVGAPSRYAFPAPAGSGPVRVRFAIDDGSRRTGFPPDASPAYILSRSLPDFRAPLSLRGGLAWSLVGIPVRASHPLSLGDLAAASGADRLFAAAWKQGTSDISSGEYLVGDASDSLPTGGGLWLASGKETFTLPMGRVFSIAPGPDQAFSFRLHRGWNQIANPALEDLPWVVSKNKVAAYDQSPVKGLHEYIGNGKYADVDTLKPWKGYFVLSNADTTVRVSATAGTAAGKAAASGFYGGRVLKAVFEPVAYADGSAPAPIGLRLGAASYAKDGLALEDEAMPTAPGQGAYLAATRAGRRLRTDMISLHPGRLHAWRIAWNGAGAGTASKRGEPARLKLTGLDLPENALLWAMAPSWNSTRIGNGPRRLSIGEDVVVPDLEGDTLVIWAATAAEWSPGDAIPELAPTPSILAAKLEWGSKGGMVTLDLPQASGVIASLYAVDGRCLTRVKRDRLAPGRHVLALPLTNGGRMRGMFFLVLDFPGLEGGRRSILRTFATAP